MTAVKDTPRPITQHRTSFSASSGPSVAPRNSLPRNHIYASSLGSSGAAHRVTRRKSSTLTPAAVNAAVQALESVEDGNGPIHRRSVPSRVALGSLNAAAAHASPPDRLPPRGPSLPSRSDSAVVDGPPLASILERGGGGGGKNKVRRASDGSSLSTSKKKSGHGDLKCETCGKGYKHSSCLTKHLWEHTPEWAITSKLLISKHQQVQLLEAASVLVAMNNNQDGPEAAKSSDSEQSYASPAASAASDREDSVSSVETTPPPADGIRPYRHHRKRTSNASSAYSHSYQSVFSSSHDPPHHPHHSRQWSHASNRPGTGRTSLAESYPDEDHADLAAAVGLLSCSYGTPQVAPVSMPADVPPVPPLPEKYQVPRHVEQREVAMEDVSSSEDDTGSYKYQHSRHEDDDGVFGKMDE